MLSGARVINSSFLDGIVRSFARTGTPLPPSNLTEEKARICFMSDRTLH